MPVLIVLLVLLILGELFTLLLQCRRGHSAWGLLRLFRYAHRGYHDKPRIPENSMAAFRRAIENGFGAELDVHLMKDGRLAVIHDASLKRTAGADVLVEDLTAEELKTYRLEGTDEQIPLLEEVLELFQDRTPLIIELKAERGNHAALAEATCRMLDRYRVHYCIESFDPRCLIWLKKNRPEIVRGQLSEQFLRHGETAGHGKATMWLLGNLFSNIAAKPDFIAYRFSDRDNLCLRWCRKFYHVQEINWTIRTKEEMEAVLQKVNLLGFLQTQDGLQTQLLEKASNLSGGQCQRLVIARALLRTDSAVYIFDEAASNIDVESEELIMNVIHELAKTKTVLLISHRLANVVKSDKIYFLKDGEIKESGKHDELMSRNGAYRHLYESQMALENYGKGGVA